MRLRDAVTLALVGWYLLAPPTYRDPNGSFVSKTSVPLRFWQNIGSYDKASDCEDERKAWLDMKKTESPSIFAAESDQVKPSIVGAWSAICVPSDDSRLREK